MAYKLRYLPGFNMELAEILEAQLLFSVNKAQELMDTLEHQLEHLRDNPRMYEAYENYPPYRKMVVLDFLVFYTVNDEEGLIEAHRIIPGRMDLARQLR